MYPHGEWKKPIVIDRILSYSTALYVFLYGTFCKRACRHYLTRFLYCIFYSCLNPSIRIQKIRYKSNWSRHRNAPKYFFNDIESLELRRRQWEQIKGERHLFTSSNGADKEDAPEWSHPTDPWLLAICPFIHNHVWDGNNDDGVNRTRLQ